MFLLQESDHTKVSVEEKNRQFEESYHQEGKKIQPVFHKCHKDFQKAFEKAIAVRQVLFYTTIISPVRVHYGKYCMRGKALWCICARDTPIVHERNQCFNWFIVCVVSTELCVAM